MAAWADTWRTGMKCAFPGLRQLRFAILVFGPGNGPPMAINVVVVIRLSIY